MKRTRGIWVHVGLLAVAGALAWNMSARTVEPSPSSGPTVDLWRVEPDQITSVVFDATEKRVSVESKHDTVGDYAVVSVETFPKSEAADAGSTPKPAPAVKRFISVDSAQKLREGLARFKILRTIGKVDANRASEFGLDKPEGTLRITLAQGAPRTLTVGSSTPGGGNYYVRDQSNGLVQVAVGDPIAILIYAESRMTERDLHAFKTDDVTRVAIQAGGKKRQLVRATGKPNAWADTAGAKEDETASNWVTKLTQLRVTAYEEKFPVTPTPIVRVEYGDTRTNLGFVELFKVQGPSEPRYVVRSERSRWFAEVIKSQAEQLERDVSLVAR